LKPLSRDELGLRLALLPERSRSLLKSEEVSAGARGVDTVVGYGGEISYSAD